MADDLQPLLLTMPDVPTVTRLDLPPQNLAISRNDGRFLVRIDLTTGAMEYGPGYTPDEAARTFWEAMSHWGGNGSLTRLRQAEAAIARARAEHVDDGNGYCTGCGAEGYCQDRTPIAECPTLAALDGPERCLTDGHQHGGWGRECIRCSAPLPPKPPTPPRTQLYRAPQAPTHAPDTFRGPNYQEGPRG